MAPSPQVSPVRHVMYDISLPVPHSVTSENDTPILLPLVWVNGNPVETSPLTHHPPSLVLQQPQSESTKLVTRSGQPQATTLPAKPQKTQSTQPKSQETQLPMSQSKPRPEPLLPALGVLQKGSSPSPCRTSLAVGKTSRAVALWMAVAGPSINPERKKKLPS